MQAISLGHKSLPTLSQRIASKITSKKKIKKPDLIKPKKSGAWDLT